MNTKIHVVIAGGSGLVGKSLVKELDPLHFTITILSRNPRPASGHVRYVRWDPETLYIDPAIQEADVVINLTGEGIADKRWTKSRKKLLLESRLKSVETLYKWLASSEHKPRLFIGASAVGYYGHRGDERLTEQSAPGHEFLADQCVDWEEAYQSLIPHTGRILILRIGIVLSLEGGALPKMLMTKPFGFLSWFGSGDQYFPWIHMKDLCNIMKQAIAAPSYQGVVNAVAPQEITNKKAMLDLQKTLKGILLVLPVPAFVLKLMLGEMSRVVLNSNRVIPERLQSLGFQFQFNDFSNAVSDLLAKRK